jgi:hypothetical protein
VAGRERLSCAPFVQARSVLWVSLHLLDASKPVGAQSEPSADTMPQTHRPCLLSCRRQTRRIRKPPMRQLLMSASPRLCRFGRGIENAESYRSSSVRGRRLRPRRFRVAELFCHTDLCRTSSRCRVCSAGNRRHRLADGSITHRAPRNRDLQRSPIICCGFRLVGDRGQRRSRLF